MSDLKHEFFSLANKRKQKYIGVYFAKQFVTKFGNNVDSMVNIAFNDEKQHQIW